jgi:hypothetical protein
VSSHAKIITTATGLQDLLGDLAGEKIGRAVV